MTDMDSRVRAIVNRGFQQGSPLSLAQQLMTEVIDPLMHSVHQSGDAHDAVLAEVHELRRQQQAVLDLCDPEIERASSYSSFAKRIRSVLGADHD